MPPADDGPHIIYVNRKNSIAIVHRASCRFAGLRQRFGANRFRPLAGSYAGPFEFFKDAWTFARAQDKRSTRSCGLCMPGPPYDDYLMVRRP